jgi:hypothetical protein
MEMNEPTLPAVPVYASLEELLGAFAPEGAEGSEPTKAPFVTNSYDTAQGA